MAFKNIVLSHALRKSVTSLFAIKKVKKTTHPPFRVASKLQGPKFDSLSLIVVVASFVVFSNNTLLILLR